VLRDRRRTDDTLRQYMCQLHLAIGDDDEGDAADVAMHDAPAATGETAVKRAGPVSAVQQLEVEDVLDIEAQHRLDLYRAWTAADSQQDGDRPVAFVLPDDHHEQQ
jgi:hypothetical protein